MRYIDVHTHMLDRQWLELLRQKGGPRYSVEPLTDKVEGIYKHFGLSIDGPADQAMKEHIRANPKDRHGKHEYRLDDWGMTTEEVVSRFAPYIERFNIGMD